MIILPEERRERIIEILKTKDYAEIPYLSETFNVSEMTIRRDIDKLEKDDRVIKVYGGVRLKVLSEREWESPIEIRKSTNSLAKQMISREALKLINDGDVIAFDASTTALELSRMLKFERKVTVVTNNLNIAIELAEDPEIPIILLGGFIRRTSLSVIGSGMNKYLESINIDKAFISCKSFNFTDGVTDFLMDEGEAKQAIIKRSNEVFLLADTSKINTIAFFKICDSKQIDYVITDNLISHTQEQKDCLKQYQESGAHVIVAE